MAEWEEMWRCKECGELNHDYQSTCTRCGKSKLQVWKETVYRCKNCGHFEPSHGWGSPGKCPVCGK